MFAFFLINLSFVNLTDSAPAWTPRRVEEKIFFFSSLTVLKNNFFLKKKGEKKKGEIATLIYVENKHVSKILLNSLINDGTRKLLQQVHRRIGLKSLYSPLDKNSFASLWTGTISILWIGSLASPSAFPKLTSISAEVNTWGKLDPNSSPENLDSKHKADVQEAPPYGVLQGRAKSSGSSMEKATLVWQWGELDPLKAISRAFPLPYSCLP